MKFGKRRGIRMQYGIRMERFVTGGVLIDNYFARRSSKLYDIRDGGNNDRY